MPQKGTAHFSKESLDKNVREAISSAGGWPLNRPYAGILDSMCQAFNSHLIHVSDFSTNLILATLPEL
jgi:hypothetical protein